MPNIEERDRNVRKQFSHKYRDATYDCHRGAQLARGQADSYLKVTSYKFKVAVMVLQATPAPLTESASSAAKGEVPFAHFVWYSTGFCARQGVGASARFNVEVRSKQDVILTIDR